MYKLYEIYDEEQDIFFHDTCCYNSMYEIEEYKKMCEQFSEIMLLDTERLMRRAFKSVWLTNGNELSEKQCVGLLLLFVPYITTNSLYELRFFDTLEQASSWLSHSVFSEKNKRGFLRSFPTGCTNIRKAYTLTAAARENLLEALPKKYVETSIRTSDAALTKLNCHNAFCCHLYYWFLSEYEFPYFEWYSAPFFDDNFSFLENVEKTNGKAALVPKKFYRFSSGCICENIAETGTLLFYRTRYVYRKADKDTGKVPTICKTARNYATGRTSVCIYYIFRLY